MLKQAAIAGVVSASIAAHAGATILAHWDFETLPSGTFATGQSSGSLFADGGHFAASSIGSGFHASASTAWSGVVGNGSVRSLNSNNWAIGDYYEFTTSTAGYQSITVQWDQTRSATGPEEFTLQWSLDGSTFTDVMSYAVLVNSSPSWTSGSYAPQYTFGPIALPAGLDDEAIIYIRMAASSAAGGTGGTNRIDDVIISGVLIPAPGALALLGLAGVIGSRRRRN